MSPDDAALTAEVGVVQDVVVEAIGDERVAGIVCPVQRPVLPESLRREYEHPVIAQLVVLDDCERLERLPETDAVGQDAAVVPVQLLDRPQNPITLELVQLRPHRRVEEAGPAAIGGLPSGLIDEVAEERGQDP